MAGEGSAVQFPVAAVERHAATVEQTSAEMARARAAVHEVTMDTEAYGQLCQFLPAILSPVFGMAVDLLNEATDALQETASALRTTATEADATDTATAERVRAAGGGAPAAAMELPL
ncbi:hypothetical protein [Actinoplanes sp. N902-109]|uniref:hypothetical protein n=1 Tax=Actinoplanes sp. (strain N902-109) TaxID=649831 RepID=UPI0003296291|nr:hypothetical protein [Actinoplanes sp. N902-109]AGL18682.1 hypothetical protein L083_5172 [Actinoplanes sp. N902-109]